MKMSSQEIALSACPALEGSISVQLGHFFTEPCRWQSLHVLTMEQMRLLMVEQLTATPGMKKATEPLSSELKRIPFHLHSGDN